MDMEMMDMYRRPYSGIDAQGYGGEQQQHHQQQHEQHQGQQYPFWNHHQLMALYQQHQQRAAAVMMGQGNMHPSKQTEPKPRLAKDEVELLEREFSKNPKPNSSTKRELAEQMGVEVPRINNWFQNRRAKEKQMRKTAEFEAQQQQAGNRSSSESKSSDDQDEGMTGEFYSVNSHHQPTATSTAAFGSSDDDDLNDSQDSHGNGTPEASEKESYSHVDYNQSSPPAPPSHGMHTIPGIHTIAELGPTITMADSFDQAQTQDSFQRQLPYPFGVSEPPHAFDGLPTSSFEVVGPRNGMMHNPNSFGSIFVITAPQPRFPSEMITECVAENRDRDRESLADQGQGQGPDDQVKAEEAVSPFSMPESPPVASDMRFKSPPPPADIAGRRNLRRPAPLGLTSLKNASHGPAPKTGIDAPRRSDTASPMRRISSATGSLPGRVQKTSFVGSSGPRSPFALDRNKEALLQTLQSTLSPIMASLNSAMSPMSPDGTNASDEDQGYTFGSLGSLSLYKTEPNIKTPPGTPGLPVTFHDPFYPSSVEQHTTWSFVPQDEPLPTPSLCSHGGSELEFSMAPQMPGYVASQPVTPSFPPSIGPTYNNGFFGSSLNNAEYNFPDSYPPESSARSSPGGPPKSKQFQFAQNITPQDFNTDKS